jgi:hypothetical protein
VYFPWSALTEGHEKKSVMNEWSKRPPTDNRCHGGSSDCVTYINVVVSGVGRSRRKPVNDDDDANVAASGNANAKLFLMS